MKPYITFEKIWSDEDVVEIRAAVSDGRSVFTNESYTSHNQLEEIASKLSTFRSHIRGGLLDLRFGEFGPEYAGGAFHARLHFHRPGRVYISTHQQSSFEEFSVTKVASDARLYLMCEPIQLDNFIDELRALSTNMRKDATLKGA